MRRFRLVAVAAVLAGCGGVTPTATDVATAVGAATRFDDLLRYAPDGLETLIMADFGDAGSYADTSPCPLLGWLALVSVRRAVITAGEFRHFSERGGDFEGVLVTELAEAAESGAFEPAGAIAGHPLLRRWEDAIAGLSAAQWWRVLVTPRLMVEASRRELLANALRGDHPDGVTRVSRFGHERDVAWSSSLLVLRRFEPPAIADYRLPTHEACPIESMCCCLVSIAPLRFRFDVRSKDPDRAVDVLVHRLTPFGGGRVERPASRSALVDPARVIGVPVDLCLLDLAGFKMHL